MRINLQTLLFMAHAATIHGSVVSPEFVDLVAKAESRGDHAAVGDSGNSLGAWQMSLAAWMEVDEIRRKRGLPIYDWKTGSRDPEQSRIYATMYLKLMECKLHLALRRPPKQSEVYAAFNLGFNGFKRRGFDINRVPKATRSALIRMKQ